MTKYCNVCKKTLIAKFFKVVDPITKEIFAIHKCSNCGLGHTIPHPKNLSRYYGNIYYGNRHSFTSKYCIKRRIGFLYDAIDNLEKKNAKRLLDIGCGDGSFLIAAQKSGWEVMGTEIAPNLARSFCLDVKETLEQVLEQVSYSKGSLLFDCITMWHSLEHINDIKTTLSQLSKLLKPDGKLIIAVPDSGSFQSKFFKSKWLHLDVPRHLYHFDISSLSFCLKDAGFKIENQWNQELEYDLIGWSQSALNLFLPIPNAFLNYITGKAVEGGRLSKISHLFLGSLMTALFLPVVAIEKILGRGGTLIIVANRNI